MKRDGNSQDGQSEKVKKTLRGTAMETWLWKAANTDKNRTSRESLCPLPSEEENLRWRESMSAMQRES